MTGTIDLSPDGAMLLVRFQYREDLVDCMRTIPGRRWDRGSKVWRVPVKRLEQVVDTFLAHGFAMAPEVSSLLAGTAGSVAAESGEATLFGADTPPVKETPPALSLSILNERVRESVRGAFPDPVWVVGEIVDYDKNQDRRHVFFSLVEKREGQDTPAAQAEVALFAKTATALRAKLQRAPEPLTLRDGLEIRALVRVDIYPQSGRYQLIIEDIDPAFTLGAIALGREQILRELRALDLHQRNVSLPLPHPPLRIGVLASPDSDGWNDFAVQLEASGIGFEVTCFAIRVQGRALRPTVLRGLDWFAARAADFDVLCILRGGGSRTDLAWFDDREVALAVARHPLPVVCGIGHQRDQSVLDVIARSEKTPTAVGAALVDQVLRARAELAECARTLVLGSRRALLAAEQRAARAGHALLSVLHRRLAGDRQQLRNARERLHRGSRAALRHGRREHDAGRLRVARETRRAIQRARDALERQQTRQRLLDPKRVLQRGYALVESVASGIVKSATELPPGTEIHITLRDGRVHATTTDSETHRESRRERS